MDETHNREEEWITVNFLTMMSLHNYSVTEQTPKRTTAKRPGKATATLSTEGGGGNTSVTKRNIQGTPNQPVSGVAVSRQQAANHEASC